MYRKRRTPLIRRRSADHRGHHDRGRAGRVTSVPASLTPSRARHSTSICRRRKRWRWVCRPRPKWRRSSGASPTNRQATIVVNSDWQRKSGRAATRPTHRTSSSITCSPTLRRSTRSRCPAGRSSSPKRLMKHLRTEGQLAGVLAHETGHVVGRHSAEQLAKSTAHAGPHRRSGDRGRRSKRPQHLPQRPVCDARQSND